MKFNTLLKTFTAICILLNLHTSAATRVAATNGNWDSGTTWGGTSNIPAAGDSIVIPNGVIVTFNSTLDLTSGAATIINILAGGTLQMNNGKKLKLAASSYVNLASNTAIITHGGGGNNTYIEVGGVNVWSASLASGITGPQTFPTDALPVVLTSFRAAAAAGFVSITWTTASEINNDYFEVQKSTDMVNFVTTERVQGHGTTLSANTYNVTDNNAAGTVYYRLVQVDFDGTTTTSDAVVVTAPMVALSINVYPNPSAGAVFADLGETSTHTMITIIDITGKTVAQKTVAAGMSSTRVNILDGTENLRNGFYTLTLTSGQSVQSIKLQILN